MIGPVDKVAENKVRRRAKRLGLELRASRARRVYRDDFGQYMLVNPKDNTLFAGPRFNLPLDRVDAILAELEQKLVEERRFDTAMDDYEKDLLAGRLS